VQQSAIPKKRDLAPRERIFESLAEAGQKAEQAASKYRDYSDALAFRQSRHFSGMEPDRKDLAE
jgi:hypothetical protein